MKLDKVLLTPKLSIEKAEEQWLDKPIDPSSILYRPKVSTYYQTPDGEAKLLLLKNVLDPNIGAKTLDHLKHLKMNSVKGSRRKCLKGSPGEDLLLGYKDELQLLPQSGRKQTYPQLSAGSVHQFKRFRGLWPLCWEMEDILREHMPSYWAGREIDDPSGPMVRAQGDRSIFFKTTKENRKAVAQWESWNMFYSIPGSNFTTITVNHNTRFLSHKDSNNSSGALSCMAVFGTFGNGELAFPRLGVAIDAKPGDMLVCDCPQELHGTLSASQGSRYSVVVYTREGLTKAGFKVQKAKAGI